MNLREFVSITFQFFTFNVYLIAGTTFANDEFQASIKNYVPEGHTFKAFPI